MKPVLILITMIFQVLTSMGHRLITDPYLNQQYDSVIVSSDPITIREKTQNDTTPLKPDQILKHQKRSYEECPDNDFDCLYGNEKPKKLLERLSNEADVIPKKNFTDGVDFSRSRWTMIDSLTRQHTREDAKGWVTLDPVPWSTSKISKWHPNKVVAQQETKPWTYESSSQLPPQQLWVPGSGLQEQRPSSQWGIGTNDLIVDNRPSDFPMGSHHGYGNSNRYTSQGMSHLQEENSFDRHGSFNDYHHHHQPVEGTSSKHMQSTHPATYPINGNGEWVLLSATKGYSHSQNQRWSGVKDLKTGQRFLSSRNIKPVGISRYHEENLSDKLFFNVSNFNTNRKSDEMSDASNSTKDENETTVQILYSGVLKKEKPVTTTRQRVRLQVLPPLQDSSTLHGGLLEVDASSQTVDEAQEENEKLENAKTVAIVKKNKIRGYKLIPTSKFTGKSSNHKNMMTLAAVGAGMIPATMALLVPMALGRRKRSFLNENLPTTINKLS